MQIKRITRTYTFGLPKTRDKVINRRIVVGDRIQDVEELVQEEYVEEGGKVQKSIVLGGDGNHFAVWPSEEEVRSDLSRKHGNGVRIVDIKDETDFIEI